ncbi:MAG: antitoxin VapB family protein [Promethearchaeota archaeon]
MVSKNISIRLDLYQKLRKLKEKRESFSDVIERLLNEGLKGSTSRLMKYFGVWADFPEEINQNTKEFRKLIDDNIESRIKERLNDFSG